MAQSRSYNSPKQVMRRERILQVTQRLIDEEGVGGVRMSRIADQSGVSPKTLYNIFESREHLLLQAATRILDGIAQRGHVEVEPGIPTLIALTENTMAQLLKSRDFMKDVLSIVILADAETDVARQRLGRIHEAALVALSIAREREELVGGVDIEDVAKLVAANQWGLALLWVKDMIDIDTFARLAVYDHCLSLMPLCKGRRRQWLENKIKEL